MDNFSSSVYISHTEFVTIDSTIAYLNGKGIMDIKEEYKKEIVNAINSLKVINSTKGKIYDCLNNIKSIMKIMFVIITYIK